MGYRVHSVDFEGRSADKGQDKPLGLDEISAIEKSLESKKVEVVEDVLSSSTDPMQLFKAQVAYSQIEDKKKNAKDGGSFKSYMFDPNMSADAQGYKKKPSQFSPSLLRQMASEPIIAAIIGTRQAQISAFAKPQTDEFSTGFRISKKAPYYSGGKVEVSKSDKDKIQEYTKFFLNCGDSFSKWEVGTFSEFLEHLVEDSLILDQAVFEVGRRMDGRVSKFKAVDGGTFVYAQSIQEDAEISILPAEMRVAEHGYLPSHAQIKDGNVCKVFYPWEISFGIRNGTTDIRKNLYGTSELEKLGKVVTNLLNSFEYNSRVFTNGSHHDGFFFIKGDGNRSKLADFQNAWQSKQAGVKNSHKTPVLQGDGVEYIKTKGSNKEMEFQQWQQFLLKLSCAVFKISPEEIGFDDKAGGNSGSTFESSNENKLEYSRDKGLKPLLAHIEAWINKHIMSELDDDFQFEFVGLSVRSEEELVDLLVKKTGSFMTLNEARERLNLEPLENGDIPLNSVFVQNKQAESMAQMAEEAGDMAEEDNEAMGADSSFWDGLGEEAEADVSKAIASDSPYLDDISKAFDDLINGDV